jgi:hypothetical protein
MDITIILTAIGVVVAVFGFLWTIFTYFIPKRASKSKLGIHSFQRDNEIGMWLNNKSDYDISVFMIVLEIQGHSGCAFLYVNGLNEETHTISSGEVIYIQSKMHPKQKSWIREMAGEHSVISCIVCVRDGKGNTYTGQPFDLSIYAEELDYKLHIDDQIQAIFPDGHYTYTRISSVAPQ